jgi:hypothetical protein
MKMMHCLAGSDRVRIQLPHSVVFQFFPGSSVFDLFHLLFSYREFAKKYLYFGQTLHNIPREARLINFQKISHRIAAAA